MVDRATGARPIRSLRRLFQLSRNARQKREQKPVLAVRSRARVTGARFARFLVKVMSVDQIPLSRPDINEADIEAVVNVLRTSDLSLGPKVSEFEAAICLRTGARYATAVDSGTAALHLAVHALEIRDGDEVITTPFSFVASANCVLFERAKPVFADIDPNTLNIDPVAIEAAITPRTKAILPVHVFGVPADMDAILAIAERHGLVVIEDACEALGSRWQGKSCGTFGKVGTFAFYQNKQMTTGEGGVVVTDDPRLNSVIKSLRNQGRDSSRLWLQHERLGFNYRIADINCALGISQLARLDQFLAARRRVVDLYRHYLGCFDEIELPLDNVPGGEISWFVYVIRLRHATRARRDAFLTYLRANGIACSHYFPSIHLQPFFRRMGYKEGDFPVSEGVSETTVALPFFNRLTEQDVQRVATVVKNAVSATR
jgi:dTDP-4-amino-4,6-dideoxygalactose transaminase